MDEIRAAAVFWIGPCPDAAQPVGSTPSQTVTDLPDRATFSLMVDFLLAVAPS